MLRCYLKTLLLLFMLSIGSAYGAQNFLVLPFTDPDIKLQQGPLYSDNLRPHFSAGGRGYAFDYIKGDIDDSTTWQSFEVRAAAAGVAMWSCQTPDCDKGYGRFVIIKHDVNDELGRPYFSLYAHLGSAEASIPFRSDKRATDYNQWKRVEAGELVGIAGASGLGICKQNGTCIHLHLEVFRGGYAQNGVDPYDVSTSSNRLTRDNYPPRTYPGCGQAFLWEVCPPLPAVPPPQSLIIGSVSAAVSSTWIVNSDGSFTWDVPTPNGIRVGDQVVVEFTYDTGAADSRPADPTGARYVYNPASPTNIRLRVNGLQTSQVQTVWINIQHNKFLIGPPGEYQSLFFIQGDGGAFPGFPAGEGLVFLSIGVARGTSPNSFLQSDSLPTSLPEIDLSEATAGRRIDYRSSLDTPPGTWGFSADVDVSSLRLSVAEPPAVVPFTNMTPSGSMFVRKGNTIDIIITAENVDTCTLTKDSGTQVSSWGPNVGSIDNPLTPFTTQPLVSRTSYTLSCTPEDEVSVIEDKTLIIKMVPVFGET